MDRPTAEDSAVTNFREYLRIKTVQPTPDYSTAAAFLKKQATEIGLAYEVIECDPGKPVIVMTLKGSDSSLPSVLLNSHVDVVPVFPKHWKHDPFAAVKEENGDIHARGSQDMKCVGIQYLEAIRRLKKDGKQFLRTIHLSFVPEEETGAEGGMVDYVNTDHFRSLNVGFALDEGLANPGEAFTAFNGERAAWCVKVTCPGNPGHGSRFIPDNAAEKLRRVINSFLAHRDEQEQKLKDNPELKLGDVNTINMNLVEGGVQPNVVPTEFSVTFDIRITPSHNLDEFEAMMAKWCSQAGPDVKYEFIWRTQKHAVTSISREDPWWNAFMSCMDKLGHKIETEIFSAATDSSFLRGLGYPAVGFSPMNNTPILLHDHNEFLNEQVFLHGIEVYYNLLPMLANVPIDGD